MISDSTLQLILLANGVLLTLITAVYAWLTWQIQRSNRQVADVMRLQLETATRPFVVVATDASRKFLQLVIRNSGTGAARNLRIVPDTAFYMFAIKQEDHLLSKYPPFSESIPVFGPLSELRYNLAVGWQMFAPGNESLCPKRMSFDVHYEYSNKTVVDRVTLDYSMYGNVDAGPSEAVEEAERIRKELEKIRFSLQAMERSVRQNLHDLVGRADSRSE